MQRIPTLLATMTFLTLGSLPARAQWSTDSLSLKRTGLASAKVGDLALFAGGGENQPQPFTVTDVVDIYDSSSETWSTANLSVARQDLVATAVGSLALFAGGRTSPTAPSAVVDVFDSQAMAWSTATLSQARAKLCAVTVGTKAFFAGGAFALAPGGMSKRVDIYDASIGDPSNPLAWSTAELSQERFWLAAASAGTQALFAGGFDNQLSPTDVVDIYDDSTGLWFTSALSEARAVAQDAAVSLGTRAYFAGGITDFLAEPRSDRVDIYDASTNTWSTVTLSEPRSGLGAAAVGNTLMFAGGWENELTHNASDIVDVLVASTHTWLQPAALSQAHTYMAAITIGGKAMFPGGKLGSGLGTTALIDVYEPVGVSYCAGNPPSSPCPCGNDNDGRMGGCYWGERSFPGGGALIATGSASIAANDTLLIATGIENNLGIFFGANNQVNGGNGNPLNDGLRCAGGGLIRLIPPTMATGHQMTLLAPLQMLDTAAAPGVTRRYQYWFRTPGGPCGQMANLTNGYEIVWGT